MSTNFSGKTVIITGASSGIGRACAIAFARAGANVVLAARDDEKLGIVAQFCMSINAPFLLVKTDVTSEIECRNLVEKSAELFGGIDVLVNNAGITMRALFADCDLEVIRRVMEVNFWGTVYCTKFAMPYLLKSKGSVVGVSSIAGITGLPGRTGYSASKFAMEGFLEALRVENLKTGLHVLTLRPGYTSSDIRNRALSKDGLAQGESPLDENKIMTPEQVANKLIAGISSRKRTLSLTSEGKSAIFIKKFFPAWLDRIIYNKISKEKDSPF